MIEGQFHLTGQHDFRGNPRGVPGIRSGDRFGKPRRDRQMGHGNNSPPRIPARAPICGQLFKVDRPGIQGGFLTQLTVGGVQDLLTGVIEEASGQSRHALKRIFTPLYEQNTQSPLTQRQDHEIDRQQYGRG
ncbi:hypothetical protein GCM10010342_61530 [Streptomyces anulatus]|nr:hypothetical protein GCM10010342_61530 [Streptomyces anulatus]